MKKFFGAVFVALGISVVAGILVNQKVEAPTSEDAAAAGLSGLAAIWAEIVAFFSSLPVVGVGILGGLLAVIAMLGILWAVVAVLSAAFGAIFGGIDFDG